MNLHLNTGSMPIGFPPKGFEIYLVFPHVDFTRSFDLVILKVFSETMGLRVFHVLTCVGAFIFI